MNIGVNDGHTISGYGTGAVGIINEGVQTRIVGNEVRRLLKEYGHNAINCTVDHANSVTQGLSLIMNQANRQDLDWFIAIHFNAGGGVGVETYTYMGRQHQDAIDVCSNITKLGFRNRGVKDGKGLYVIRKTKAKSMLIEVCFVDTADANHYLKIGYKAIARAIVEALIGTIKATPVITPKPIIVVPATSSTQWYRVRESWANVSSQIGAFKDLDKAKKHVDAHPGFEVYNTKGVQIYPVVSAVVYKTVTASVLNVRSSRGITNNIVGKLKKGEKVKIDRSFPDGWTSIYFGNHGGFVSTQYLK
jgi:uncharacterized protein YgiM (DUF1202 family)